MQYEQPEALLLLDRAWCMKAVDGYVHNICTYDRGSAWLYSTHDCAHKVSVRATTAVKGMPVGCLVQST